MSEPSKEEVAQRLANTHYAFETGITQIYRLVSLPEREGDPNEPIKLLEISTTTPSSGVMPLGFGPAAESGIPYPSVIVEVTPTEFDRIKKQQLPLPDGWTIGEPILRLTPSFC